MSKQFIELITCDEGDWEVLRVNCGEDFHEEGHSLNNDQWIGLLDILGYKVEKIHISNEKMENGDY